MSYLIPLFCAASLLGLSSAAPLFPPAHSQWSVTWSPGEKALLQEALNDLSANERAVLQRIRIGWRNKEKAFLQGWFDNFNDNEKSVLQRFSVNWANKKRAALQQATPTAPELFQIFSKLIGKPTQRRVHT